MARTSAIISLVVVFVLAVLITDEVQASPCMRNCNSQCLKGKQNNGVSCGVSCFVECLDDGNKNNQLSPEVKAKIANLKKMSSNGSIKKSDMDSELREIALHMMQVSESDAHHHLHKYGEKPVAASKTLKENDDDITDDDDVPDVKVHLMRH